MAQKGGEVHGDKVAIELIEKLPDAECVIADNGYDSKKIRECIHRKKATPIISRKQNSKVGNGVNTNIGILLTMHLLG